MFILLVWVMVHHEPVFKAYSEDTVQECIIEGRKTVKAFKKLHKGKVHVGFACAATESATKI